MLKHGLSDTREYHCWYNMIDRCYNTEHAFYDNYGGRGISVCKRWRASLEAFIEDMGLVPEGKEIDRRNNDGDYRKSNCRWVKHVKNANNKQDTVKIEYKGKTLSMSEWSRKRDIPYHVIQNRLAKGLDPRRVLERV